MAREYLHSLIGIQTMSKRFTDDPPDPPEDDRELPSADQECELNGHSFEGYDTISEMCSVCGLLREYSSRDRPSSEETTTSGEIHICWTAGDHAFGMKGVCVYCGKAERDLTTAELDQHAAAKRARKDE
jgi:hypothetical protein